MSLNLIFIVLIILCALLAWVIFLQLRRKDVAPPQNDTALQLLLSQMNELTRTVDTKIGETTKHVSDAMRNQFSESSKLIKEVTEGLTKLDETNRQVVSFADQLQNLQDILKNPKQRGILGEFYLETLLKNTLSPTSYQMQYAFGDGEIVDAAVFVKDKVIPVDSKFSLENYNRMIDEKNPTERERLEKAFVNDLKLRISETAKYIRPQENTMDFAFMFIPHEAIYYDLLTNKIKEVSEDAENLIERAARKYKVIIVSPTSFLAYLQTVLQGLRALQIEETAKDIIKRVAELGKHLKGFEEYHFKLGNALGTVVNHYNAAGKEFKKIDKDIMRITGSAVELGTETVDKPDMLE